MNFDIRDILFSIPGILLGLSLHEFAHAYAAVKLGDDTPKYQGRLTTNPMAHIDPIGLIFLLIIGFGWAKPVEVNELNFKNRRRDDIIVSLAGPLMNLFLACAFLLLMKALYFVPETILPENLYITIMDVFDYTVWINVVLFVFNLLPVPPLDGSHIFFGLLGLKEKHFFEDLFSKGRIVLSLLIISNAIDKVMGPPIVFVYSNLLALFF